MSSYFETLKSLKNDILVPAGQDMIRSAPDSLFIGSALMALLTQNYPLGILTLAMVEFGDNSSERVRYLRKPFHREPDFGVTSVNYSFSELLGRSEDPK